MVSGGLDIQYIEWILKTKPKFARLTGRPDSIIVSGLPVSRFCSELRLINGQVRAIRYICVYNINTIAE
jgi:hypothetical protein